MLKKIQEKLCRFKNDMFKLDRKILNFRSVNGKQIINQQFLC